MNEFTRDLIDIKNGISQNGLFDANDFNDSFFVGGGEKDKRRLISDEFADIVPGSRFGASKIEPLLREVLANGVDGVRLESISADSFVLAFNANAGTTDRIKFTGDVTVDAIRSINRNGINIPDRKSQFGIFNYNSSDSNTRERFFLGGGANAKSLVSQEFDDLIGGANLGEATVPRLYEAATTGDGIDNVDVLFDGGQSNFTLALNVESRGTTDIIVFNDLA